MVKNTQGDKIILQAERQDSDIIIRIYDNNPKALSFEPHRDNLANGKGKAAIKHLYGFCDYHIIANFQDSGWKKINMFNSKDIATSNPHPGYTHELVYKRT